jgi:ribonucleotide reductase alpha subunit
MLSFKLSEEFVDSYRSKPEKFGFNGLGNIVFYRTYSRVKENGEYETWTDVCARVINGMYSLLQDHARKNKRRWDSDKAQKDAQEAFDRMFNFKWTPSGRGLWMMGTPFIHERKTSEALLNCAFIGTENIKQEGGEIFEWIANMLMLGVGVAFDTKGAGEVLVSSPRNSASTYLVDDSREGWARSIKVLVNSYLDGTDVALFDYSMVRKKGEPIKGFGGVASGPEPLMLCHDRIREYMNKNVGKKITSRTITDICNAIGACVVAGNVRRSAELALGEADDQDYIALKNYSLEENKYRQEIGWASNNSIIGDGVKQYGAIAENIRNNGEPGVVWLENIERYGRMGEEKHDNAIGVNPCSEIPLASREMCVSGDTYIQTRTNGITKIKDLIGVPVEIWNGEKWANVTPFETGKNALYRITLSDGSYLDATPNHKWLAKTQTQANMRELMTKELSVGMKLPSFSLGKSEGIFDDNAYAYGWFAGDGFMDDGTPMAVMQESEYFIAEDNNWKTYKAQHPEGYNAPFKRVTFNGALNPENCKQLRNKTDGLPKHIMSYDNDSIANFIGGWIDADGHLAKQTNTDNYILYGTEQKIRDAQLLLRRIGIDHASIQLYAKKGEKTNFGIRNYDLWKIYIPSFECEAIKTQLKKATRFGSRIGANPRYSGVKIDHARTQKIIRIEKIADSEQTYCFFEQEKNMGVFGNVITKQCNLSEIYMQNMDDEYDFQRTIKFAYLYSKAITLTYEWITDSKSRKIMMKNRRVGVGTTAIAQFLGKHSVEDLVGWWDRGYKLIQSYDDRYSQWLGIPKSIRTTTIKPSGTVSLLAGATPGIHYPHDNFYIRRVRIQDDTPMLTALQYAGYKIEKDVYSANTSVIEIPIKVEGETSKNKTLWEQLQLASLAQRYWSDNSVSVTISFKPSNVTSDEIANAISLYAGELKCVSMLPITEEGQYEQMPYESITKEKYEEMIGDITPIANLAEHMSIVNKMKDLYCENDSCVIK